MAAGYRSISFARYALAGVVIAIPALLLEHAGRDRWAWAYVVLVLIMLAVFYSGALSRAASYTSSVLRKG